MAALIWTEPALQDLDAIADYIALDNPVAAPDLVQRVFQHVEQLQAHPESGSLPPELRPSSRRYRQIVEPRSKGKKPHSGEGRSSFRGRIKAPQDATLRRCHI